MHALARLGSSLPLSLVLTLVCADALAEEDAPTLEEIVVSADRANSFSADLVQAGTFRNARLIDTPLTVNVVPRTVLDAQAASGLYDALRNTAGVSRAQLNGATYDNIAIRGILVENRGNYRLNGSLPIINLIDLPLENKERVEVLKGVSALYYGFAPPSGIINMTTKRATTTPVAALMVSANAHGGALGHVDLGSRFGSENQFGVRFNGVAGRVDTGIDNVDGERSLAAAAFDWDATENTVLQLDVEHIRKNITESAGYLLPTAVNGVITLPPVPSSTTNLAGDWQDYDAQATNVLARAQTRWSDRWSTIVEVGQAETERDRAFSQFEITPANLATTGNGTLRTTLVEGQYYRNRNARFEVATAARTGMLAHEVVLGATSNKRFQNGRSGPNVLFPQNLFNPVDIPETPLNTALLRSAPSTIQDDGLYLSDRIRIGDQWHVLAGVRYSDYENRATTTTYGVTEVSPSIGIVFKPQPNISVYGTYLEGLEEGGTAPANTVNASEVLPPSVSKQYELGFKMEVFQGLGLTLAAFDIDRPSAFTNPANVFVQDGRSHYRGLEFVASGEVTPELSLIASGLYLDAELRGASDALVIGKRPENTPEYTGSVFAEYRMPVLNGFAVNAGAFYISDRAVNNRNQAFIGGVTTFSAGARYGFKWADHPVTTQINIENLTDKDYWNTAGNNLLGVGAPRTVKVSVSASL